MGLFGKIAGTVLKEVVQVGKQAVLGGGGSSFGGGIPANYGNTGGGYGARDIGGNGFSSGFGSRDVPDFSQSMGNPAPAAPGGVSAPPGQSCRQACAQYEREQKAVCDGTRKQAREHLKSVGCPSVVRAYKKGRRSKCCAPRKRTCSTRKRSCGCGCKGTSRSRRSYYSSYGFNFYPRYKQAAVKRKYTEQYGSNKRRRTN